MWYDNHFEVGLSAEAIDGCFAQLTDVTVA